MGHSLDRFPLARQGKIVKKKWGKELIIENNDLYCGKLLIFKKNASFSMHFHMEKDESWYVADGEFDLYYVDTENAKCKSASLKKGDCIRIFPGMPHQLECKTDNGTIFEVSTTHRDEDSYRLWREEDRRG